MQKVCIFAHFFKDRIKNKNYIIISEMKNALIQFVEDQVQVKDFPQFKAGDTITVTYKIVEGNKERLQKFQGVVLQRSSEGSHATFTVRKISGNVGVERIFPISSPMIESIEKNKEGAVRRDRENSFYTNVT